MSKFTKVLLIVLAVSFFAIVVIATQTDLFYLQCTENEKLAYFFYKISNSVNFI